LKRLSLFFVISLFRVFVIVFTSMARHVVGTIADFPEQHGVRVLVAQRALAIFRIGADLFAVDDSCPHRRFPLNDGVVSGQTVQCRTHGSCFNLATGALERGPARVGVNAYAVFVVGDQVEVEIP
jgi:nitrite reductase/ring-hydroxylating ferredoxin subunit